MSCKLLSPIEVPLSGWGRYPVAKSFLQRPEQVSSVSEVIKDFQDTTVIARGAGRSYGDAAINYNGQTLLTEGLNRVISFNKETGLLCCEAGLSLKEIIERFVPLGWFPSVTPGTKFVTVGGAVAFDVHGKNHHQDGSFCRFVSKLKITLATGETVQCSRKQNSDLFWATVGGMGLTGIITEVELALRPIETAYIDMYSLKAKNLDEAIALFDEHEPNYQYSVAWIDCLASGKALGRSIIMFGNHATRSQLPPQLQEQPLSVQTKYRLPVPFEPPSGLLNRYTMSSFNALYYGRHPKAPVRSIVDYDSFFYPLDFLKGWNRLYGKEGFIQYQCVFPPSVSREALVQILNRCSLKGCGSFLAVLKRFGSQEGLLSFPMPGYTLALDIPIKAGLWEFLDQLDRMVIQYGGRVYLAKDARLSPASFREMYPNFPQWLSVKSKVDPNNYFSSALSKRLEIDSEVQQINKKDRALSISG